MDRAHTDQEIIRAASSKDIAGENVKDNKADIAVDLADSNDVMHTYVVTFKRNGSKWEPLQVNELSSL